MLNLETVTASTVSALKSLRERLSYDYHRFLAGKCTIKEVIRKPFELLQFSVTNLLENLNINLPSGMEIKVNSSIPMGCGLGSSSALVISTLYAVIKLLGIELDYSKFINMSRQAENLQHGKSSGLNLHLSAYGGIKKFQNGQTQDLSGFDFPFYIVNTGSPISSTGECVAQVSNTLKDPGLLNEFENTLQHIESAINSNNIIDFKTGIRKNHELLTKIGVVPDKVQSFIRDIECANGASKVCGAGSVAGNNAGAVIVLGEREKLQAISKEYNYNLEEINLDFRGAHLV